MVRAPRSEGLAPRARSSSGKRLLLSAKDCSRACAKDVLDHHLRHYAVEFRNWIVAAAADRF